MQTSFYSNRTLRKSELKRLLQWSLRNHGFTQTCYLSARLKVLGFQYATQSGLSIGLGDLQTSAHKASIVKSVQVDIHTHSRLTERGLITLVERASFLRTRWTKTSDRLKTLSLNYFQQTQGLNPVFLMCSSGARGNVSQIRQLVAMRGLMADSSGNVLEVPIRSNFREGLTLAEYFISCYGARKGVVDTALGTAKSGYLTRRLSYVVHDLTIAEVDCSTAQYQSSVLPSPGYVLARTVLDWDRLQIIARRNTVVTPRLQSRFKACATLSLSSSPNQLFFVRSPLSCNAFTGICQLCYGWSLAQKGLVGLGEGIGILAAQSIGEPSTQLTMRTFHTGGVFDSQHTEQMVVPHGGQIGLPKEARLAKARTSEGTWALFTLSSTLCLIASQSSHHLTCFAFPPGFFLFVLPGHILHAQSILAQKSSYSFFCHRFLTGRPNPRYLYQVKATEAVSSQMHSLYASAPGYLDFDRVHGFFYMTQGWQEFRPDSFFSQIYQVGFIWLVLCEMCPFQVHVHFDVVVCCLQRTAAMQLVHCAPHPGVRSDARVVPSVTWPTAPMACSPVVTLPLSRRVSDLWCRWTPSHASFHSSHLQTDRRLISRQYEPYLRPVSLSLPLLPLRRTTVVTPAVHSSVVPPHLWIDSIHHFRSPTFTLHRAKRIAPYVSSCFQHPLYDLAVYRRSSRLSPHVIQPSSHVPQWNSKYSYVRQKGETRFGHGLSLDCSRSVQLLYCHRHLTPSSSLLFTFRPESKKKKSVNREDPFQKIGFQGGRREKTAVLDFQKRRAGLKWIYYSDQIAIGQESLLLAVNAQTHLLQFEGAPISSHTTLYTWFASTLKTGDIIQGLPQLEKRFEARSNFRRLFESLFLYLWRKQWSSQACAFSSEPVHIDGYHALEEYFLVHQLQHIYVSQGISIEQKHLEVIVRQLYFNCFILDGADSGLLPGDIVPRSLLAYLHRYFQSHLRWASVFYGVSENVLETQRQHFLTVASFQRTQSTLSAAALRNSSDFLLGLKQNIMFGHLLPIGAPAL